MPGGLDLALVALFAVAWPLYTTFVDWPRYLARLRAGVPGARMKQYLTTLLEQWGLAAAAVALWMRGGRAWAALGLRLPLGWRAGLALGLVALIIVLLARQLRAVAARRELRDRLRKQIAALDPVLPHSVAEFRAFLALAVTAGVCEELLFRGFFIWALRPWLTWWGAGLLGSTLFGLAHAYQGRSGMIRAGIAGVGMTLVYGLCGSLLPGMALHAIIDIGGGWTTWLALREEQPAAPAEVLA